MNKMVNHLRSTAQCCLTIWKFDINALSFIVGSDAGGVGSLPDEVDDDHLPSDGTQGAWMVLVAERIPKGTEKVRVSPLSWRSLKLKRRVPSTLAGEALAMSQEVSQVEWLQILMRDAIYGDTSGDWPRSLTPFGLMLRNGDSFARAPQTQVIDAKSVFDVVQKGAGAPKDRRTAIELAIVSEALAQARASVRWIPHFKMFVDALTKPDLSKCTGALLHMLVVDEETELQLRASDAHRKDRSRAASERSLEAEHQNDCLFSWLFNLNEMHEERQFDFLSLFCEVGPPSNWQSEDYESFCVSVSRN